MRHQTVYTNNGLIGLECSSVACVKSWIQSLAPENEMGLGGERHGGREGEKERKREGGRQGGRRENLWGEMRTVAFILGGFSGKSCPHKGLMEYQGRWPL